MSEDLLKDPLPEPWTFGVTQDGRIFFINDQEERTTWLHPVTNEPIMTGYLHNKELPIGWQKGYTVEGAEFYINHKDQTTTLKFPNGKNDKNQENSKSKRTRRPSFTGSLFRRSSSKSRDSTSDKKKPSRERPSSAKSQQEGTSSTASVSRKTSFASTVGGGGGSNGMKLIVVRRDPNSSVIKQGWLYKQNASNGGGGGIKTWRKRWFLLLSDFCLFYYKDTNEGEVLGSILLPSYSVSTVTTEDKISRKYAFKVSHPGMRTLFVSAESYNDMAEWIQALTPICNLQDTTTTTTTSSNSPQPSSPQQPPSSPQPATVSPSSKKKASSAVETEGGFDEFTKKSASSAKSSPATKQKTSKETTTKNKKAAATTTTKTNGRSKSASAASTKKRNVSQKQKTAATNGASAGTMPRQSRAVNKSSGNQNTHRNPPPRSCSTPGYLDEQSEPESTQGHQNNNIQQQQQQQQEQQRQKQLQQQQEKQQQQQQQQRPTNGRSTSQVRGRVTVVPDQYQQRPTSGRSIGGTPSNSTVSSTRPLSRQEVMQHQQRMYNSQFQGQTLPRNMHQNSQATLHHWVQMKQSGGGGSVVASEIAPRRNYTEQRPTSRMAYHQQQQAQAHYQHQMQQKQMYVSRRHRPGYPEYMDNFDNQSIMSVPAHRLNHHQQQPRHVVRMPQMQSSSSQNLSVIGRSSGPEPPAIYEQQQQQQQSRVRSSKSQANLNDETEYNIPQTKSDNFDLYSQHQHNIPERNVINNSASLGSETYQRHQSRQHDGQMGGRAPSVASAGGSRSSKMDVKSFNGPNKLRAFAAISIKQPPAKPMSDHPDGDTKEQQKQQHYNSHHQQANDVVDDSPNREEENADAADQAEFQARRDRLDVVKKSLSSALHQLQLSKQEGLGIDQKIEDAKAASSFTEQYEWEEASLHNKQKMLDVAKNLEAMKGEVSELEKNYRQRKSAVIELLSNDVDVNANSDKLKDLDQILKRAKQCKVEIINLLDYYKSPDPLQSPRKSDVSANSYSSGGSNRTATSASTLRMLRSMSCSTHNDIHDDKSSTTNHQDGDSSTTVSSSYKPSAALKHATSVDNLTAAAFAPRSSSSMLSATATLSRGRPNGKSARERLSSTSRSQANLTTSEIKKIQNEITKNQRNTLTLGRSRARSSSRQPAWIQEAKHDIGTDITRAIKNQRMPKVLKKVKLQQKPAAASTARDTFSTGFDFDSFAQSVEAATGDPDQQQQPQPQDADMDLPPPPNDDEMMELESQTSASMIDYNPNNQLTAVPPDKVNIPDRLIEFDDGAAPLTADQERLKRKKIRAIESMLARTGQPVLSPNVHLAASIAAEAGTVARLVAMHATQQQEEHQIAHDQMRHQARPSPRRPSSSINSIHSSEDAWLI